RRLTIIAPGVSVPPQARGTIPPPPPCGKEIVRLESLAAKYPDAIPVGGNVKEPRLRELVDPMFPEEARRAGVGGTVVLEVLIDRAGYIGDMHVIEPGPCGMTQAATEAV